MIAEEHRHVEVAVVAHAVTKRGQMKARRLVTSIVVVKEQVHPGETFVDVLRREVVHVIVIPERAHRLLDVAADVLVSRVHSGKNVGIMLIVKLAWSKEVARIAI